MADDASPALDDAGRDRGVGGGDHRDAGPGEALLELGRLLHGARHDGGAAETEIVFGAPGESDQLAGVELLAGERVSDRCHGIGLPATAPRTRTRLALEVRLGAQLQGRRK